MESFFISRPFVVSSLLLITLYGLNSGVKGQSKRQSDNDSVIHSNGTLISAANSMRGNIHVNIDSIKPVIPKIDFLSKLKRIKADSAIKSLLPSYSFKNIISSKPLIKFRGGYISYNMNYRTNIDTPLAEKNILQNSSNGSLNLMAADIPLRVNFLFRRSNSTYFRDINDIQIEFDAGSYRNFLQNNLRQRLLALVPNLKDSLLEVNYKLSLASLSSLNNQLTNPMSLQKLLESKEILTLPDTITNLTDSLEKNKINVLQREAKIFIEEYENQKKQLHKLSYKKDSLEKLYVEIQVKIENYKDLIYNKLNKFNNPVELKQAIKNYGLAGIEIPPKYQFMMNVRKFGIGHNQLNYSELTCKNISLTGLNFEYNSWYYLALAVGTVDYRFRDFVVNRLNKSPQFLYMARLGIGKLEKNYFIVSMYKGQKQIFASGISGSGLQSINIHGISAETKIKLASATFIQAEAGESLSPDFRKNPAITQKFDLKDASNKAFSLKFYSFLPKTNSSIEAMYKYTGSNFQSFSSFQTNSRVKAWSIKADQQFINRKLKITVAIKTNDFSNPYIIQNYKSNTVFKSIQANFRTSHFPMISIGYVPISQLTYVDSILTENRFQSLNAAVTHFYKIGERKASSSLVFNRFYNNLSDTSFAYYNAENIFFSQNIEFYLYAMNLSISHSKSPGFELNVLDAFLNIQAGQFGTIGFGLKVNSFDKVINTTGPYGSLQIKIKKLGVLSVEYDNGFLPANNHRFIKSNQLNINFIKQLY